MNCPICDKAGLAETTTTCPQCNSDLSGFSLIQNIASKHKALKANNQKTEEKLIKSKATTKRRTILGGIMLLLLLCSFAWLYLNKNEPSVATDNTSLENDSLKAEILKKEEQITLLKQNSLIDDKKVVRYTIRKGDNLIKLARFYYNNEDDYKTIMNDNNIKESNKILIGDTLTIKLKD